MKWTVVAKIYDSGRIVANCRPTADTDVSGCTETRTCDIWVEIFNTEAEARQRAREYETA